MKQLLVSPAILPPYEAAARLLLSASENIFSVFCLAVVVVVVVSSSVRQRFGTVTVCLFVCAVVGK
jgi:hypothetical protein